MRVPPAVLTLTTMTILWVNSRSPERKNQQLWLDRLKQRGLDFIGTGTLCHESQIRCWHRLWWVNGYCSRCCAFPGTHFALPVHFRLLTRHSLISEISGQGFPKGEGYRRTCRVRVSWPRLNLQVLPEREQGLHSLHSPTSQCTKLRETKKSLSFFSGTRFCGFWTTLRSDGPWGVHSMSLSLGSKSSGQTWWHLPLSRYRPWRHRVHVSLFTQDSQSAGHSAKTTALRCICLYLGCPNRVFCPTGQKTLPLRKVPRWNHCLPDGTGKPKTNHGHRGLHLGVPAKSNPKTMHFGSLNLLGAHSLCASLRTSPSGQVSWHLPRWR